MTDKPPDINHLVFVVHGIGQRMYAGSVLKCCAESVIWSAVLYFYTLLKAVCRILLAHMIDRCVLISLEHYFFFLFLTEALVLTHGVFISYQLNRLNVADVNLVVAFVKRATRLWNWCPTAFVTREWSFCQLSGDQNWPLMEVCCITHCTTSNLTYVTDRITCI